VDEIKAHQALAEIGALSLRLVKRPGTSSEDAIVVAAALMRVAEMIVLQVDGPLVAAALFRDVADRLSAKTH
jgi:hypothetical protein